METWESRIKRWAHSGSYLVALNGVNAVFPLAASLLYTRVLTQEDYGLYAYFLAIVLLLELTSSPGMGTIVVQATARGFLGTVREATRARLRSSFLGTGVLLVMATIALEDTRHEEAGVLFALAVAFPWYSPYSNFLFYLNGLSDFRGMTLYQLLHHLIIYVPAFVAAIATRDYRWVLAITVSMTIVARYGIYRHLVRGIAESATVQPHYLRSGMSLTALNIFAAVEANLDRVIVGSVFSPTALATFHLGKNFSYEIRKVWNVAYQYAFPSLARRSDDSTRFPPQLLVVLGLYVAAVVLFMLAVPYVIEFLYPESYRQSTTTAQWLLGAILVGSPGAVIDTFFITHSRLKALWLVRTVKILIYLGSLFLLTSAYGLYGIYYATMLAAVVYTLSALLTLLVAR